MQPQSPTGQYGPQQPYNPQGNPQGPANNGQNPAPYGPPGQPGQPLSGQPNQPITPGQPAVPAYQLPNHLRGNSTQADNLPPPPAAPSTPYDFFMQQPKPAPPVNPLPVKGRRLTGGMNPYAGPGISRGRMFLLIGGAVALIGIVVGVIALSPKDPAQQQLLSLAQTQQEIARVCDDGAKKATLQPTRNFAITCSTSIAANQTELTTYMQQHKFKFTPKELALKASATTDAKLKSAAAASTYDTTFMEIVQAELTSYGRGLTGQLGVSTGANIRTILNKDQNTNQLLLQLLKIDSDQSADTGS